MTHLVRQGFGQEKGIMGKRADSELVGEKVWHTFPWWCRTRVSGR